MAFVRPRGVITLTTDFGLSDHYVGTMKGVLLSRCPDASIVDISHEISPFSIYAGAYAVSQAAPYFPSGSVHLVVVDPGVGTARRGIVAEAIGQIFVAPDNGVLSLILNRDPQAQVVEITNAKLWLDSPSSTFHGRDIFAPVAAALASGTASLDDVGPPAGPVKILPDFLPIQVSQGVWSGKVLSIDHFGNVITNFEAAQFEGFRFQVTANGHPIAEFHKTFGQAPAKVCFMYFGSSGYVELGMNQMSAVEYLEIGPGDPLTLRQIPE